MSGKVNLQREPDLRVDRVHSGHRDTHGPADAGHRPGRGRDPGAHRCQAAAPSFIGRTTWMREIDDRPGTFFTFIRSQGGDPHRAQPGEPGTPDRGSEAGGRGPPGARIAGLCRGRADRSHQRTDQRFRASRVPVQELRHLLVAEGTHLSEMCQAERRGPAQPGEPVRRPHDRPV